MTRASNNSKIQKKFGKLDFHSRRSTSKMTGDGKRARGQTNRRATGEQPASNRRATGEQPASNRRATGEQPASNRRAVLDGGRRGRKRCKLIPQLIFFSLPNWRNQTDTNPQPTRGHLNRHLNRHPNSSNLTTTSSDNTQNSPTVRKILSNSPTPEQRLEVRW